MATRDSYLVKQIKKLEKIGNRANSNLSEYYFYKSPEGQAAEAIDHIHEVVHESLIAYDENKRKEKDELALEKLREKMEKKSTPRPAPLPPQVTPGLSSLITTNKPWWKKILNKILLKDYA